MSCGVVSQEGCYTPLVSGAAKWPVPSAPRKGTGHGSCERGPKSRAGGSIGPGHAPSGACAGRVVRLSVHFPGPARQSLPHPNAPASLPSMTTAPGRQCRGPWHGPWIPGPSQQPVHADRGARRSSRRCPDPVSGPSPLCRPRACRWVPAKARRRPDQAVEASGRQTQQDQHPAGCRSHRRTPKIAGGPPHWSCDCRRARPASVSRLPGKLPAATACSHGWSRFYAVDRGCSHSAAGSPCSPRDRKDAASVPLRQTVSSSLRRPLPWSISPRDSQEHRRPPARG